MESSSTCRLNHADNHDWWGICTSKDAPRPQRRRGRSNRCRRDGLCWYHTLEGARPLWVFHILQPNIGDFGCIYQGHLDCICRSEAVCRWSWPFLHNQCLYLILQGKKVWSVCSLLFDRDLRLSQAAYWWLVVTHLHFVFWRHERVSCKGRHLAGWRSLSH